MKVSVLEHKPVQRKKKKAREKDPKASDTIFLLSVTMSVRDKD